MSPQKNKYHYLREREHIRQDPRLTGLWALGSDTVSSLQEQVACMWPNDPLARPQEKKAIELPLHWILTQKMEIDTETWNQLPYLWATWSKNTDGNSLKQMVDNARFLDVILGHEVAVQFHKERKIQKWRQWGAYRNLLNPEYKNDQQLRGILLADLVQYTPAHPLRNVLMYTILDAKLECWCSMNSSGIEYPNGWGTDASYLTVSEQEALVRETARFLDYALPVLHERFGLDKAVEILCHPCQGLLNYWFMRNAPEVARSVKFMFQPLKGIMSVARVNARMPLKRLPLLLLHNFGTDNCWYEDAAHVCLGGSLRDLPSFQPANSPKRVRISPRAAHILGQMDSCGDYQRDLYRAVCLAVWPDDHTADVVARYYDNAGMGNYNDPFIRELMLFFERNQAELRGARLSHLIDYMENERRNRRDFSLKGRSLAAILRRMEAWHEELGRLKELKFKANSWLSCGIQPFYQAINEQEAYFIKEINTQYDLIEEGRVMRHCVAGYIDGCIEAKHSIWSLSKQIPSGSERLMTIQVNHRKTIVQACGPYNRQPTKQERQLLKNWATFAQLKLDYR